MTIAKLNSDGSLYFWTVLLHLKILFVNAPCKMSLKLSPLGGSILSQVVLKFDLKKLFLFSRSSLTSADLFLRQCRFF